MTFYLPVWVVVVLWIGAVANVVGALNAIRDVCRHFRERRDRRAWLRRTGEAFFGIPWHEGESEREYRRRIVDRLANPPPSERRAVDPRAN